MNNIFSENLKRIRKEHNISQEQLAEKLGVSRQAISKWESGSAYPEMDKIITLCEMFEVNIDDLLHNDIKEVKKETESKKSINKFMTGFLDGLSNTVDLFTSMSHKSRIKCIIEQIIIIAILFLLGGIIFAVLDYIISLIIHPLSFGAYNIVNSIIEGILLLVICIVGVIVYLYIFKNRYLDYYELKEEVKDKNEEVNEDKPRDFKKEKIIIRDPKHSDYKFASYFVKCLVFIIKAIAIFFGLFIALSFICLIALISVSFLIKSSGIFFYGVLASLVGSAVIIFLILLLLFNFLFNRKNNKKFIIYTFIASLILVGLGVGFGAIGSLDFKIVSNKNYLETKSLEIPMQDYYFFHDNVEYIEKNINTIEVEYKIYNKCHSEYSAYEEEGIYLWGSCEDKTFDIIKDVIDGINDKKVIELSDWMYDIKVYTSRENIEKLKINKDNYLKKMNEYYN